MSTRLIRQFLQFELFTKGNKECPIDSSHDLYIGGHLIIPVLHVT